MWGNFLPWPSTCPDRRRPTHLYRYWCWWSTFVKNYDVEKLKKVQGVCSVKTTHRVNWVENSKLQCTHKIASTCSSFSPPSPTNPCQAQHLAPHNPRRELPLPFRVQIVQKSNPGLERFWPFVFFVAFIQMLMKSETTSLDMHWIHREPHCN